MENKIVKDWFKMERKCMIYVKLKLDCKIINDYANKAVVFKKVCINYFL